MKVTIATLVKFLSDELGQDVEVVDDEKLQDFNKDEATNTVKETLKPEIERELKPALEAAANTSAGARSNNSLIAAASREFGIPKDKLNDKSFSEQMKLIKEHVSQNSEANEWKEKHDNAVRDYEERLENKENEWKTKYESDLGAEQAKFEDFHISNHFRTIVDGLPLKGGDKGMQAKALRSALADQGYTMKNVEGKLEIWKGDKKIIKNEDVIKPIAESILPITTNTKHVNPASVQAGQEPNVSVGVEQTGNYDLGIFGQAEDAA